MRIDSIGSRETVEPDSFGRINARGSRHGFRGRLFPPFLLRRSAGSPLYFMKLPVLSLRRSFLLALCALAQLLPGRGQAQNQVLFIGNSFTIGSGGGGVPGIFDRLAQAGGQPDPFTVMQAVGGQDFQYHSQDPTALAAIASRPWTHVVLQNYSTEPTHLASGSVADHYTYGTVLYEKIMQNNPRTQVILFETWSRSAANSLITGVSGPNSFASTAEFQAELRANYQGLADSLTATHPTNPPVLVAPVGDAWENAGGLRKASDPLFIPLFASDEYHGNNNGYYLAACVFYSLIYGVSPHGLGTNTLVTSLNLGLTVPPALLEDYAWATVSSASQAGEPSFLIDFGSSGSQTLRGPAPGDPFNSWNNVTEVIGGSDTGALSNLVTTTSAPTEVALVMLSRFNGANTDGVTASTVFPASASRDSLFGNTEMFGGVANIFPRFKLTGLNPDREYTLTFYASRNGVSDNRETSYTVTGASGGYAALNAANNVDGTAVVAGMQPDAQGTITVSLAPTTNNNNGNHFTYLGAMRIDVAPEQEPIVFTRQPSDQTVIEGQIATFSAAVQGTPPYFIQWFSNNAAIPGANQFTCRIPATTTNLDGLMVSLSVSNLAYSALSDTAVLHVTAAAANPDARALFFDFGGASTTLRGPAPNDPLNSWNNVTSAVGASSTGRLTNLVTAANAPTTIGLVMLSRFNGVNENGATDSTILPVNATRDSLFGNTEAFSGLANVFPSFKLAGLNPQAKYKLRFYASRMGVGDNRETRYTVVGATTQTAVLNAANNVNTVAEVVGAAPSAAREITISLAPTAANNNANHFTYLGALRLEAVLPPPEFLPVAVVGGRLRLDWAGEAQLERAASLAGPWLPITPNPTPPYLEDMTPDQNRFFRLVTVP